MKKMLLYTFSFLSALTVLAQTDTTPTPQWRPLYHFTPKKNWTNDPNGLIYMNGVYHLYNQQNPFENKWGHMSWGHATSTDLVHWKHWPVAIPEAVNGNDITWRYSGSAVWDKNNTSGWCKNKNCIVAIYTAHQPNQHKESQYVAYSNDGGMTYTHYEKNPVIDLNKQDFRDPNVFWYEPKKYWVMAVVLPAEHKALFYNSYNLKDWKLLSEFGPQGYTGANWECPFLIQLPIEGKPNAKKWVLAISAAGGQRGVFEQYFVGDFDGKTFTNNNAADSIFTLDYGDTFYAAIPWNNLPGNQKTYIGWMIPNPQATWPWRGQMSIPRDLSLRETPYGLRLVQKPTAVIQKQLNSLSQNNIVNISNLNINNKEIAIDKNKIKGNAYWIKANLHFDANTSGGFKIAQQKDASGKTIHETTIGYDAAGHELFVDRTNTGGGEVDKNHLKQTVILAKAGKNIQLEILLDKSSLEVFVNNGEAVITTHIYPIIGADHIAAFSNNGNMTISNLKIWNLSSVNK